jgi:methylated-DNA-[protein]-cysteine S-methyltransferase
MSALFYDIFETSWGWVGAVGSEKGMLRTSLPELTPDRAVLALEPEVDQAEERPGAFPDFQQQVEEYLSGQRAEWDVKLDPSRATDFFQRAWEVCRSIPQGETRTYKWLAEQAGKPHAPRAAGQAMARNRFPLIVPCHRVVGSDGKLHGFGGGIGLPLKARLLELERQVTA